MDPGAVFVRRTDQQHSAALPTMTLEEFLAVITAMRVRHRLNPKTPTDKSSAFSRLGHWDDGPAFIRTTEGNEGLVTAACRFLTGKKFSEAQWGDAARYIGLPFELAIKITEVGELVRGCNRKLRRGITAAAGLSSDEEASV